MADRLVQAGVQYARGFSTNVANFQPTDAEVGYARAVSAELAARGVAGSHFVIDTGRNGAGSTGEVCNPPTARVGAAPKLLSSGALDAYLWIKTVGETDGACNGGPASGFSTALALALTKGAFLKAPTKPTAKLKGSKIAVTWKKRAGATAYQVIFTPKKGKAIVKVVKGTKYTLVKPKKKMTYKVQVTARGTSGYSTRSRATVVKTR
jgi:cellulase/cellobiase CelA1